jgi:hypothetical protein
VPDEIAQSFLDASSLDTKEDEVGAQESNDKDAHHTGQAAILGE